MEDQDSLYYVANPFDDHSPGFWDRYLTHSESGPDDLDSDDDDDDDKVACYLDNLGMGGDHDWSSFIPPLEMEASRLAIEVVGLASRLAERHRLHERSVAAARSHTLHDTFLAGGVSPPEPEPAPSPAQAGEWVAPPVYAPEAPRRVAAEADAVNHMLSTAAYWMASVDITSVPLEIQEGLFRLTATCLAASLRFPGAGPHHSDPASGHTPAPPPAAAGTGATLGQVEPSGSTNPQGAPSSSNRTRRPRRRRRH